MSADDVAEYFRFGVKDHHKTFNSYENNDRGPSKERLTYINSHFSQNRTTYRSNEFSN